MNQFTVKAAAAERTFIRKYGKEGYRFLTGLKKINLIHKVTKDYVYHDGEE